MNVPEEVLFRKATTLAEITAALDFADPILGVSRDDPYMQEHYKPEHLLNQIERGERVIHVACVNDALVGVAMVKNMTVQDKADRGIMDYRKMTLCEYWAIDKHYRARGVINELIKLCKRSAVACGISVLVAEVEYQNLPSLRVAYRHTFVGVSLRNPSCGIEHPFHLLMLCLTP